MLISEIRDEIIEESGGDLTDTDLQGLIFRFIRASMRKMPRFVLSRTLVETSEVTVTSGSNNASLPSNFVNERYVYRKDSSGNKIEIVRKSWQSFHEDNNTIQGELDFYMIRGKKIYFNKSSLSGETVYVEHFAQQVGSSFAVTDAFYGNDDEIECVKSLVKAVYYGEYQEDSNKAASAASEAAAYIRTMNNDYMESELPSHVEEA
jgi:hypothetical protein